MGCGASTVSAPKASGSKSGHHVSFSSSPAGGGDQGSNFFIMNHTTAKVTDSYSMPKKAKLGEGSYGTVYKAVQKVSKKEVAIKAISKKQISKESINRLQQEIDIMKTLDHPNIIRLYETFADRQYVYLVLEQCYGGELFDRIIDAGSFTESEAASIMLQILRGIYYMHENGLMHRDLKPENFLFLEKDQPLDKSYLKIIDFGLSRKIDGCATTKAGTPYYVAPQVLSGKYDEKCDVWSIGVICFVLLCGYPPFGGDSDPVVLKNVKRGQYEFDGEVWKHVSSSAKDFINQCLTMNPSKRASAGQAIKHPWLTKKAAREEGKLDSSAIMKSLRLFQNKNRFHKRALVACARMMNSNELHELDVFFNKIDKDQNGMLSHKEIMDGFKEADVPANFQEIVAALDTDGSGSIEYTEWLAATLNQKNIMTHELLWQAFILFDKDHSGFIDESELAEALSSDILCDHDGLIDREQINQVMTEVDTDGDNQISFDEFCQMLNPSGKGKESKKGKPPGML